ncbi:MAG: hypothetical protein FWG25_01520 [Promicromonosporaceae bacterium]|nr:hypothetical protein [Promicromonosporaceae bacterium]
MLELARCDLEVKVFVLAKPSSLKHKLQEKGLAKLVLPKATKVLINAVQLGPRVVMRSALHLLRANPITRLFSVLSLVVIDAFSYVRKKISGPQFLINLTYSATMLVGSTAGWYTGQHIAEQLAFDFVLGLAVSLVCTMIAMQIFSKATSLVVARVAKTDCQKGLDIANEYALHLEPEFRDTNIEMTKEQAIEVFRLYPTKHVDYVQELMHPDEILEPGLSPAKCQHAKPKSGATLTTCCA